MTFFICNGQNYLVWYTNKHVASTNWLNNNLRLVEQLLHKSKSSAAFPIRARGRKSSPPALNHGGSTQRAQIGTTEAKGLWLPPMRKY